MTPSLDNLGDQDRKVDTKMKYERQAEFNHRGICVAWYWHVRKVLLYHNRVTVDLRASMSAYNFMFDCQVYRGN